MLNWAERRSIAKGMGLSYIGRKTTEQSRPSMQESMNSLQIPISEQMKNEEIQSLKKLTDGELSGWICDLEALKSKTEGMNKFERRQVRRQLKAAEAEWEQRRTDEESKALRAFTDEQLDEFVTHFHKLKEKVGEDKTVERQLRIAKKEQKVRGRKKELSDTIDELNKENVLPEDKRQEVAGTVDQRYINEHLNFIYPEVYQRTGITQNFRLYGPIQKIVMEKQQGNEKYTRKYNEDGGEGFADFMCILFPSSDGILNINRGRPDRPHLKQDCSPTPRLCAQIAAFIYQYRKMNPKEKITVSRKMEAIMELLGEKGIAIHEKMNNAKEKAFREQFSGMKEYVACEDSYEKAYTAWKNLCQVDQRFAQIDGEGKESKEQNKIFNDMKRGAYGEAAKKYISFMCGFLPKIKSNGKKGRGVVQSTLENYKQVREFFDIRKKNRKKEIEIVKQTKSFFKEYMFEEDFFADGQIIQVRQLKKANTILRLLHSATKAIDKQEYDEINSPENCIPKYTVEKMFMGYVLKGITEQKKREEFCQETRRLMRAQIPHEQDKDQEIGQEGVDGLHETEKILTKLKEKPKGFSPYKEETVNYSEARSVTKMGDGNQIRFGGTFPDCADTAMRHTLNLLGYSLEGNWDIYIKDMDESLKEKLQQLQKAGSASGGKFVHLPLKERLQLYFYYQSQEDVGANDGEMLTRSLWEYVISNMKDSKDQDDLCQMYSITYAKGDYELKSGHLNSLKVIYNVARALKENPEGKIAQEDFVKFKEAEESIQKLQTVIQQEDENQMEDALRKAIQKVYQLINPNIQQQMEIRNVSFNEYDVFAEIDVHIGCKDQSIVDFTVTHKDGHGVVSHCTDVPKVIIEGEVKSEYAKLLVEKYRLQNQNQELDTFHSLYSGRGEKKDHRRQFGQLQKNKQVFDLVEKEQLGQIEEENMPRILTNSMIKGSEIQVEFSDEKESQCMDGYFLDTYADTAYKLSCFLYDTDRLNRIQEINVEEQLNKYQGHHYRVHAGAIYAINKRDHSAAFVGWNTGQNTYPEYVKIPSKVEFDGEGYAVTEIRNRAFEGCTASKLQKVTISSNVKKIGEKAFYRSCIEELSFEDNSQLEEIGGRLFDQSCKIKKLVLPASLKRVGTEMLSEANIEEVSFGEGSRLEEIGDWAFDGCTFKEPMVFRNIKKIGEHAFRNANINELSFGEDGLKEISGGAFRGAHINGTFIIPKNVTQIKKEAFSGAHITSLQFEEGGTLHTIERAAFIGATINGALVIPKSVRVIDNSAFHSCKGITSIRFIEDGELETIGMRAFFKTTINGDLMIPKKVTKIGRYAFDQCKGIGEIRFAAGVLPANLAPKAFGERKVTA